jgi:hypothetical protein
MHRRALQNWTTHEFALRASEKIISTLEKNGVRALPVKGLLLARQVYDTTDRPITDVDLMICSADFGRAVSVARTSGWGLVWDSKVLKSVNFVVQGTAFDVKTSFGPAGISAIGVADVLARAVRSQRPLGFTHWQIEHHDHALLLAIDAFKDKLGAGKAWAREDLARVAGQEGFCPRVLVDRAADACLQTMLAIVADWVVSSAPSVAWSAVRELLRTSLRSRYIERYKRLLAAGPRSTWRRLYLSALTRAVSDSVPRRAVALALGAIGTAGFVARHGGLGVDPWDTRRTARSR